MKQDFTDEQLSILCGEALTEKPSQEETQAEWNRFAQRHHIENVPTSQVGEPMAQHRKRHFRVRTQAIAIGAVAAVVLLGWFMWPSSPSASATDDYLCFYTATSAPSQVKETVNNSTCKVETPPATTKLITLADGTQVTLSANSTLLYPVTFEGKTSREVELKGEAHFKVAHDAHHPFRVKAGSMSTQVLGTSFVVKAYQAERPMVSLIEGRVKVTAGDTSIDLVPGQTGKAGKDGIVVTKTHAAEVTDWMNGDFVMDDTPLATALETIGAWYNKTIVSKQRERMAKRIHFRFSRRASIEEVVEALNELHIAKLKITKDRVEVR